MSVKWPKSSPRVRAHSRIEYRSLVAILLVESDFCFEACVNDLCVAKLEGIVSIDLHFSLSLLEVDVGLDISLWK